MKKIDQFVRQILTFTMLLFASSFWTLANGAVTPATISASQSPSRLIAGQPFSLRWSATNMSTTQGGVYSCSSSDGAYSGAQLFSGTSGTFSLTSDASWAGKTSSCAFYAWYTDGSSVAVAYLTLSFNAGTVALTPPSLSLSCGSSSSTAPSAASTICSMSNSGQTAASGISYSGPGGTTVTGPSSCAANSTCSNVTVRSVTSAGNYAGTVSATPSAGSGGSSSVSLTVNSPAPSAPTISVSRSMAPLVAGKSYTTTWSTTNATSVSFTCTASGTGFAGSASVSPVSGTAAPNVAPSAWVGYPSTCTWTASGPGGSTDLVEGFTTVAGVTPAALSLTGCSNNSGTVTPNAASMTCNLNNTGGTAASGITYGSIAGMDVSGPTGSCAASSTCGQVIVTTGTAAGSYTGTLSVTASGGISASKAVNLLVNAPAAALSLSGCSVNSPTTSPSAASMSCSLSNSGGTPISSISYSALTGMTVSGPTGSCAAYSTCGAVNITTGSAANLYNGTLTITPNTGSGTSTAVNLQVTNKAVLQFSGCSINSPSNSPSPASMTCTLSNAGLVDITKIAYSALTGMTVTGPKGLCESGSDCGTVTITTGTGQGTYTGTLTATSTPNTGSNASIGINLVVSPPLTPAALSFASCTSNDSTNAPNPATTQCMLKNTGQTAVSSISYTSFAGVNVSGPTGACAGGSNCGQVTVTTDASAGNYSGTISASPDTGSGASKSINLTVIERANLELFNCQVNSPTIEPIKATRQCDLRNLGGVASTVNHAVTGGMTVTGPNSCAAHSANCGKVSISTPDVAGFYSGTYTSSTPNGTGQDMPVSLSVQKSPPTGTLARTSPADAKLTTGQSFTLTWTLQNATDATLVCTDGITNYDQASVNSVGGSRVLVARNEWANKNISCSLQANGVGGASSIPSVSFDVIAPKPTINVSQTPNALLAGQSYTVTWATTNATSLSYSCSAAGSGFAASANVTPLNGTSAPAVAQAAWVGFPSICTWTVVGPGGSSTFVQEMRTTKEFSVIAQKPSLSAEIVGAGTAAVTADVVVDGGVAPYSYSWARTAGSPSSILNAQVLNPTFSASLVSGSSISSTWELTASDSQGTQKKITVPITLTSNAPPAISITFTPSEINASVYQSGTASSQAHVLVDGGLAPFTYSWVRKTGAVSSISDATSKDPVFSAPLSQPDQLIVESWQVTVTDSLGSQKMATLATNFRSMPELVVQMTPNIASATISGAGKASTSLLAKVSFGLAPYSVNWNRVSGSKINVSPMSLANGYYNADFTADLAAGQSVTEEFDFEVTDAAGIKRSQRAIVTLSAIEPVLSLSAKATPAELKLYRNGAGAVSGAININVSNGSGPYQYFWVRKTGTLAQISDVNSAAPVLSADLTSGQNVTESWTVSISDQLGAKTEVEVPITFSSLASGSALFGIVSPSQAEGIVVGSGTAVASVNVSAFGGVAPYHYQWLRVGGTHYWNPAEANKLSTISSTTSATPNFSLQLEANEVSREVWQVTVYDAQGASKIIFVDLYFKSVPPLGLIIPSTVKSSRDGAGEIVALVKMKAELGKAPYSYNWVGINNSRIQFIGAFQDGDFSVGQFKATLAEGETLSDLFRGEVVDATGNNVSGVVTVTLTANPVLTVSVTPKLLTAKRRGQGGVNASAQALVTGGMPPYSYQWIAPAVKQSSISALDTASPNFSATLTSGQTVSEYWRLSVKDSSGTSKAVDVELNFSSEYVAKPTIGVTKTVNPLVVGVPFVMRWNSTDANSVSYSCVAGDGGFTDSGSFTTGSGETQTFTPTAAWVNSPSTCTWTAIGDGGRTTFSDVLTTQTEPPIGNLVFDKCEIRSPRPSPQQATQSCTLRNSGGTDISTISYVGFNGVQVTGPSSCAKYSKNCGQVLIKTDVAIGGYVGTVAVTPDVGSALAIPVNLQVVSSLPVSFNLTATPQLSYVSSGADATVKLSAMAIQESGLVSKLELLRDIGGGYVEPALNVVSGDNSKLAFEYNASQGIGLARYKLRATDLYGVTSESKALLTNVLDSRLLGEVSGVRINKAGLPELFGWTCKIGTSSSLTYEVFVDAPSIFGGVSVAVGVADVSTEFRNSEIQSACQTPEASHHFVVDLSNLYLAYAGKPLFVEVQTNSGKISGLLPCAAVSCTMPDGLRIALIQPSNTNTDRLTGPAYVFMNAKVENLVGQADDISFNVNGEWIPGKPDVLAGTYFAAKENLPSKTTPYPISVRVRKGDMTVYSAENLLSIDAANMDVSLSVLTPVNNMTAPVGVAMNLSAKVVVASESTAKVRAVKFLFNGAVVAEGVDAGNGIWNASWVPLLARSARFSAIAFDERGISLNTSPASMVTITNGKGLVAASPVPVPITITPPYLGNPDAGSLPGGLGVDKNGSATYSIPLAVPPGVNGMVPSLSLNYSSDNTTGSAGLGWSLGGISNIDRCGRVFATDGVADGVRYPVNVQLNPLDNATVVQKNDRLCLDGQRLILINGNSSDGDAYWANGAQYRTEIESFVTVTMSIVEGKHQFKVEGKDGQVMTYGDTIDSYVAGVGRADGLAHRWRLSKREDKNHNYISYYYLTDTSTGESKPKAIRWGGNSAVGQAHFAKVEFDYEARPDIRKAYLAGSRNDENTRLTTIRTSTDTTADGSAGVIANVYQLTYEATPSAESGRSLLKEIRICDGSTNCLPSTKFEWGKADPNAPKAFVDLGVRVGPNLSTMVATQTNEPVLGHIIMGDFNGDGRTDILERKSGSGINQHKLYETSTDGRNWTVSTPFAQNTITNFTVMETGDFDGDGKLDIIVAYEPTSGSPSDWRLCLGKDRTASGYSCNTNLSFPADAFSGLYRTPAIARMVKDFDADGKDDLYLRSGPYNVSANNTVLGTRYMCLSTGTGFNCQSIAPSSRYDVNFGDAVLDTASAGTQYADFDGDGHVDQLSLRKCVFRRNPVSSNQTNEWFCGDGELNGPMVKAFGQPQIGGYLFYGEWLPFLDSYSTVLMSTAGGTITADLNADGYSDMVFGTATMLDGSQLPKNAAGRICYSKGNGEADCFVLPKSNYLNGSLDHLVMTVADYNGDGILDVLRPGVDTWGVDTFNSLQVCRIGPSGSTHQCDPWTLPSGANFYGWSGVKTFYGLDPSSENVYSRPRSMLSGDFDGDGKPDILTYLGGSDGTAGSTGDRWQILSAASQAKPGEALDKLISVTNGFGAQSKVVYAAANDASVYTPDAQLPEGGDAVQGKRSPVRRQLVKSAMQSTGNGAWLQTDYQYAGFAVDATGRGSLGFAQVTSTQRETGITNLSWYWQTYPHTGSVRRAQTRSSSGVLLSDSSSVPDMVNIKPNTSDLATTILPYTKSSVVSKRDLDGTFISTTTSTVAAPDVRGNVSSTTTTTTDAQGQSFIVTKASEYDTVDKVWPRSNLKKLTEQRTVPGNFVGASIARSIDYTYDGLDQVATETREKGDATLETITTYGRNAFGLVTSTQLNYFDRTQALRRNVSVAKMTYTSNGRFPATITNALKHTETKMFDARHGAVTSVKDPNGLTTSMQYDGFGRKTKQSMPDGTEIYTYQKQCGNACPTNAVNVLVQDSMRGDIRVAVPSLVFSDSSAHPVRTVTWGFDGRMIGSEVIYDSQGRAFETYQAEFVGDMVGTFINKDSVLVARNFYDDLGRVTKVESTGTSGLETNTTSYQGLTTILTNAKGQAKKEVKDVWGRMAQAIDAKEKPTYFRHDAFNSLVRTEDSLGNVVDIEYDKLGHRTKLSDPDLGQTTYEVDALGRTVKQVSPNQRKAGTATVMSYDDLGRMIARDEPSLTSRWVYDNQPEQSCADTRSCGKLIEAYTLNGSNKENTEMHSFDSLGRPSVSTQQRDVLYTHTLGYDTWGRLLSEVHKRGSNTTKVFERRYNNNGYQFQVLRGLPAPTGGYQVLWQANDMNARMQLQAASLGNGLAVKRDYFQATGYLQSAKLLYGTEAKLEEAYTYEKLGNVMTRMQSWAASLNNEPPQFFSEGFSYDVLNRLETATISGMPTQTFTYDDIGNLKSKTGVGQGTYVYTTQGTAGYDASTGASVRRPNAVQSIPGIGSFVYDDNGNLINGAGKEVSWTSFDMPYVMKKGSENSTFYYGADHQRVKQTRNGDVTIYYAAGMEVENKAGVLTIKTYWPGGLGVEIDKPDQAIDLLWTHSDRIGSVIAMTDIGGNLVERLAYDSWGKRRALNGAEDIGNIIDGVKDNKGFTGHEMLDKLDLVHMNGRIYDPFVARFMSADPIIQDPFHSQSYNRYTYVWNNPTNLTDPTGFVAAGRASGAEQFQCAITSGCQVGEDGSTSQVGSPDDIGAEGSNEQVSSNSTDNKNLLTKQSVVAPTLTWGNVFDFGKGRLEGIVDGAVDSLTGIGSLLGDIFTLQSDPRSQIAMAQRMDTLSSSYYTFGPAMQEMARKHIMSARQGKWKESGYIEGKEEGPKGLGVVTGVGASKLLGTVGNRGIPRGSVGAMRRREFVGADYHGKSDNLKKNRGPINGQDALDASVQVKSTSTRRVGVDREAGEIVVFDQTVNNIFHGHVRSWSELTDQMQNALKNANLVDKRGRIIGSEQ
ncbi:VCBS repeat-containing protein [Undibacterium sp. LX40W]|uniref:VCBS repeat-containing protein n=1 Tax=Undibacterium nitidum TaxID=2762298 RepID=A0A923HMU0_9BURK|nr:MULTISPECIES: FG-GAP-like repeat-containing protein [Undibacterium]MBC3879965.1 VCBS repeat-containing protein [Undibacterium nitidum]MBC3891299.1 VCBS repeat-containing protein [Undibacterium sp. LX40W]